MSGRCRSILLSLSAHKVHGPKGAGALWVRAGVKLSPVATGGHQERGRRGGTENVAALAGFGVAAQLASERLDDDAARVRALRDRLEAHLACLPGRTLSAPTSLASSIR